MLKNRRQLTLLPALVVVAAALVIPASASAQASRTWVSGVGDDANPCSRTAPCKTFPGAISKTQVSGEINCLDPGGFGGVTITKAITIKCQYTEGGVLVSGTNAIVVNAPSTANVVLRGLDINLFPFSPGLNGVRIIGAKSVKIYDSEIYGGNQNGVDFEPANANARLSVVRTHIHDMVGNGVVVAPPTSGTGARAIVRNSEIEGNACGLVSTTFGPNLTFSSGCGTNTSASGVSANASIEAHNNLIADNVDTGVWSRGNKSVVRIGENDITGNATGLFAADAGAQLLSYGDNHVQGNNSNGAATGPAGHLKKKKSKRTVRR